MNRKLWAVLGLGFSSGLPLVLTGSTLQAWYTVSGVSLLTIGMLGFVGQPYLYKFLWAPFLDRYAPLSLGRRRAWICLTQLALAVSLAVMAFLNPLSTPLALAFVALWVAFFSATQDIAYDAYRTDLLSPDERGFGSALHEIGYRTAMIVSGALALILAASLGWRMVYLSMSALMLISVLITLYSPMPRETVGQPLQLRKAIIEPVKEFLTRKNALAIIIFIIIYKLCDAFALSLNTPFLIRGVGFSLVDIGMISKTTSVLAALLGGLTAGFLLPRMGLYRALMMFGFLQMFSGLGFALLSMIGKNYTVMAATLFSENFCSGLSSVAFVVFLMSLCDSRYTATQYALFSALMALGRVMVGPEAAIMVQHMGWTQFYIWTFFMGFPALVLLFWLKQRVNFQHAQLVSF